MIMYSSECGDPFCAATKRGRQLGWLLATGSQVAAARNRNRDETSCQLRLSSRRRTICSVCGQVQQPDKGALTVPDARTGKARNLPLSPVNDRRFFIRLGTKQRQSPIISAENNLRVRSRCRPTDSCVSASRAGSSTNRKSAAVLIDPGRQVNAARGGEPLSKVAPTNKLHNEPTSTATTLDGQLATKNYKVQRSIAACELCRRFAGRPTLEQQPGSPGRFGYN